VVCGSSSSSSSSCCCCCMPWNTEVILFGFSACFNVVFYLANLFLQCFGAVGLAIGRPSIRIFLPRVSTEK